MLLEFNAVFRYCHYRGLIGVDKMSTLRKREMKSFPDNMEEKFEKLRYCFRKLHSALIPL